MKKEELLYALSSIEPSNELKEQTKLKMMNIVMTRDTVKSSPNFLRKSATAICAAAFAFVCITTVGMQKFIPRSYVAVMDENAAVSMVCEENITSRIAEEPAAFIAETREDLFKNFLVTLTEDYRAIGIEGEFISKKTFVCKDERYPMCFSPKTNRFSELKTEIPFLLYSTHLPIVRSAQSLMKASV